jgi:hypothetical protein
MGQSLYEVKYFEEMDKPVYDGLLYYLDAPELQVRYGCRWLTVKRQKANNDLTKTLQYWNGSAEYPPEVFKRYEKLKKDFNR